MMIWGELALAVLLITALVVQLVHVWKQREFEPKKEEADGEVIPLLQERTPIPLREPRGPREQPGPSRPTTETFAARRHRIPHMDTNTRTMRRGIILMTILEPCRGINPFVFRG